MIKKRSNYLNRNKFNSNKKKFENPFFKKEKKIKLRFFKISFHKNFYFFIALFLFAVIVWFFCYSSVFSIKNINVADLTLISKQEIISLVNKQIDSNRFLIFGQKNIIIFDNEELINTLEANYNFENLIIDKKWPNEIYIEIQEKPYAFVWHEDEKYYYADSEANIAKEVNPLEVNKEEYPLIYNEQKAKTENRKINIDLKYIEYIRKLFSELRNNFEDVEVEKFVLDQDYMIKIYIIDGPQIYFNINSELDKQINKLTLIKNEKLKDDFYTKEYIDVQFGDRVYYR